MQTQTRTQTDHKSTTKVRTWKTPLQCLQQPTDARGQVRECDYNCNCIYDDANKSFRWRISHISSQCQCQCQCQRRFPTGKVEDQQKQAKARGLHEHHECKNKNDLNHAYLCKQPHGLDPIKLQHGVVQKPTHHLHHLLELLALQKQTQLHQTIHVVFF